MKNFRQAWTLPLVLAVACSNGGTPDATGNTPTDETPTDRGAYEGDNPGECTDGADNDRDGYFDCRDNGCWGHPDCGGYGTGSGGGPGPGPGPGNGTGTGTGSGPGPGTGPGTGTGNFTYDCPGNPLCDLQTFEMDVRLYFDFNDLMAAIGFCDCIVDFVADGVRVPGQLDGSTGRVSFEGQFDQVYIYGPSTGTGTGATGTGATGTGTGAITGTGTGAMTGTGTGLTGTGTGLTGTGTGLTGTGTGATGTGTGNPPPYFPTCDPNVVYICDPLLVDTMWFNRQTGEAYHAFYFDTGTQPPTLLIDWVAHQFPGSYVPNTSNPYNAKQFVITDMYTPYDHSEDSPYVHFDGTDQDPQGNFTLYTTVNITFHK